MPNEKKTASGATDPAPAGTDTTGAAPSTPPPGAANGASQVQKTVKVTLAVLLVIFVYHLFADRITPYTSQASIDTFLVQIAPEVSGPVIAVGIRDNQEVKKGQVLFRIDPAPFQIAVQSAEANLALALQAADSSAADIRVADAQLRLQREDLAASEELGKIVIGLAAKRALSQTSAIRARAD
ncbi:MAG TPA: biotin/lipoyl-binding protein, partial [Lysobacter sp.]|nr:biotin/lipoyl-binding protein [Lysobacter sp.]